ncbi:hypothetical protein [Glutamicibacter sp. TV12E]|uniref:hypothetical protein n=1 Tax=Glutamicibacter sp. TV12E TaxID=3446362 RepID=UPI0040331E6E
MWRRFIEAVEHIRKHHCLVVEEAYRLLENHFSGQFIDLRGKPGDLRVGNSSSAGDFNPANDCPLPSVKADATYYTDEAATTIAENLIVHCLKGSGYVAAWHLNHGTLT